MGNDTAERHDEQPIVAATIAQHAITVRSYFVQGEGEFIFDPPIECASAGELAFLPDGSVIANGTLHRGIKNRRPAVDGGRD